MTHVDLTDEHRLAVLREIYEMAAGRLKWTPLAVVMASYDRELRERMRARQAIALAGRALDEIGEMMEESQ